MRMVRTHTNDTNEDKILYRELSYRLNGLLFDVHNAIGRFGREKQYADAFSQLLQGQRISFEREKELPLPLVENSRTNVADFIIDGKILLEFKAKPLITKADYYQTQRYLQATGIKLGLLINFRNRYLKPIRIIRINS